MTSVSERLYSQVEEDEEEEIELPLQPEKGTFQHLKRTIIDTQYCSYCGSCGGGCPVDVIEMDGVKPILVGPCIGCGICFRVCNRYHMRKEDIQADLQKPFGDFMEIVQVQAVVDDEAGRIMSGGMVTAMLSYAFDNDIIDSATTVDPGKNILDAKPAIAFSKEDALRSRGSAYVVQPSLDMLDVIKQNGRERPCIVGVSCQILSARVTQDEKLDQFHQKAPLLIGLFCMESFDREKLVDRLDEMDVNAEEVESMLISKKVMLKMIDGDEKIVSLKPLMRWGPTPATAEGCFYCHDYTAESSDISVGMVGADPYWSTVIVRTEAGNYHLQEAEKQGYVKVRPITEEGLSLLKKLTIKVKKSARGMPPLEAN